MTPPPASTRSAGRRSSSQAERDRSTPAATERARRNLGAKSCLHATELDHIRMLHVVGNVQLCDRSTRALNAGSGGACVRLAVAHPPARRGLRRTALEVRVVGTMPVHHLDRRLQALLIGRVVHPHATRALPCARGSRAELQSRARALPLCAEERGALRAGSSPTRGCGRGRGEDGPIFSLRCHPAMTVPTPTPASAIGARVRARQRRPTPQLSERASSRSARVLAKARGAPSLAARLASRASRSRLTAPR